MDLVIIAADWGSGRRRGWLSNYHLAAREGDEWKVVGKTFKGLTDEEFRWMTKRLQAIKVGETDYTVSVRPEIVVEVTFNQIQHIPHYKSGFALRFARITRIRDDKGPGDAEPLDKIRVLYKKPFRLRTNSKPKQEVETRFETAFLYTRSSPLHLFEFFDIYPDPGPFPSSKKKVVAQRKS